MLEPAGALILLPDLVDLIKKILAEKKRKEIKLELPTESLPISDKVRSLENVFETSRSRLKTLWKATVFMTISAFSLFISMTSLAIITGIIMGQSTWGIIFGGFSGFTVLAIIIWKPLDKMLESNKAIQIQDLLMASMKIKLENCEEYDDVTKRNNCIEEFTKYVISQMNNL